MSPRNFEKVSKLPSITLEEKVLNAPNLWYAFTAITGIDKIFSHTADEMTNKTINSEAVLPPASYYEED